VDDFYGQPKAPLLPTGALPGSPEKIAVLQQRAMKRQALWHPADGPALVDRPHATVA
jgi:hypothetical protein